MTILLKSASKRKLIAALKGGAIGGAGSGLVAAGPLALRAAFGAGGNKRLLGALGGAVGTGAGGGALIGYIREARKEALEKLLRRRALTGAGLGAIGGVGLGAIAGGRKRRGK